MSKQVVIKKVHWTTRKTFALKIDENGDLIVRAPRGSTIDDIAHVVNRKIKWIEKTQKYVLESRELSKPKNFVEGEEFLYLGKKLTLHLIPIGSVLVDENSLCAPLGNKELVQHAILSWYRRQARTIFLILANTYATKMDVTYSVIRIKNSRTRWGSCGKNGSINLNWRLVMAPIEVIEYLVIHELTHTIYRNHSKRFYNFVEKFCPNYKAMERWLQANSHIMKMFR
jgi:predicted metal-dependent hydrolase